MNPNFYSSENRSKVARYQQLWVVDCALVAIIIFIPNVFLAIHFSNVQLANLLINRLGGAIDVLPLTISSCEISMVLPAASKFR